VKNAEEFRRNLINLVAAHAIDHPGEAIDHTLIFPRYLDQVKEAYFLEHRGQISETINHMLALLSGAEGTLEADARTQAKQAFERLRGMGYCEKCARAALDELRRERYV
jgi:serine protein kinase